MKVNYIVANYIGPLRRYGHYQDLFSKDPLYFFNKHVEFLKGVDNPEQIHATFVFNDDIDVSIKEKLEAVPKTNFDIKYRKNAGFSYGIWNDTIIFNLFDYDYFFLIEDDYIPSRPDFLTHFIKRLQNKTAVVCGLVEEASHERFPKMVPKGDKPFIYPSISNCLVKGDVCREVFNKHSTVFRVTPNNDYASGYGNQIYFCKHFTDLGYGIVDTLDEFSSPFYAAERKTVIEYGEKQPPLLEPIPL